MSRDLNLMGYLCTVTSNFASSHDSYFIETKLVANLLQTLVHLLEIVPQSKGELVTEILLCYQSLMEKCKFNTVNSTFTHKHIRFFLHFWCKDLEQDKQQINGWTGLKKGAKSSIESIIRQFLENSGGSMEWENILDEVLFLYDRFHFDERIAPIEEVLGGSTNSYDLQYQFKHRCFDYFITYLSVVPDCEEFKKLLELTMFPKDKEMRVRYPNILTDVNKVNCMNTFLRWPKKDTQGVSEAMDYQRYHLYEALIININSNSR